MGDRGNVAAQEIIIREDPGLMWFKPCQECHPRGNAERRGAIGIGEPCAKQRQPIERWCVRSAVTGRTEGARSMLISHYENDIWEINELFNWSRHFVGLS
jgi:hypothetical protein